MSAAMLSGVWVGAYRLITLPSLLMSTLLKFHLKSEPKRPLVSLRSQSKSGEASGPLTSALESIWPVNPKFETAWRLVAASFSGF